MSPVVHFILAIVIATTSLASGSLLWPRLTTRERPKLLQEVHDVVIKTPVGRETASVLGVSDEAHIMPIDVGQAVGSAAGGIKNAIGNRIQTIVVGNAVNQLRSRFDGLPKTQQEHIQQIFCKQPQSNVLVK